LALWLAGEFQADEVIYLGGDVPVATAADVKITALAATAIPKL
jgi:hypothetical protein